MSSTVRWTSDRKASLVIELTEPNTWEEFHHSVQQAHGYAREVPHTIDLLFLVPAQMPKGNPLTHFSGAIQRQPENVGSVIIVPPPNHSNLVFAFARRLSLIINKVYPKKSRVVFTGSLEEALAITGEEEALMMFERVEIQ
jgi:hypothetical protein